VRRRRRLELLEGSAVAACVALAAPIALRLGGRPLDLTAALVCGLAILAGYLAADFLSGLVHWFCDRFFEERTPLIGGILIHPFREHHRDPRAMTRHKFLELTGNSCLGLAPVLLLAAHWPVSAFVDALVLAFGAGVFVTNLLHKWAHAAAAPPAVRWLQRHRLVLAPDGHAVHHRAGFVGAYCVTTGWLNPVADRLRIFAGLGRVLSALGVPPTRADV
jgi:ubiquitin-conjugating enzyme E2 variant